MRTRIQPTVETLQKMIAVTIVLRIFLIVTCLWRIRDPSFLIARPFRRFTPQRGRLNTTLELLLIADSVRVIRQMGLIRAKLSARQGA